MFLLKSRVLFCYTFIYISISLSNVFQLRRLSLRAQSIKFESMGVSPSYGFLPSTKQYVNQTHNFVGERYLLPKFAFLHYLSSYPRKQNSLEHRTRYGQSKKLGWTINFTVSLNYFSSGFQWKIYGNSETYQLTVICMKSN